VEEKKKDREIEGRKREKTLWIPFWLEVGINP